MIVERIVGDVFQTKCSFIVFPVPFSTLIGADNYFLGQIEKYWPKDEMYAAIERTIEIASVNNRIFKAVDVSKWAFIGICYDDNKPREDVIKTIVSGFDKMPKDADVALVLTRGDLLMRYDQGTVEEILWKLNSHPTKIHLYYLHEQYHL